MIVQRVLHLLDLIKHLLAQLALKVWVHVSGINNQRRDLQKRGPRLMWNPQYVIASDNDDFRFHKRLALFIPYR